MIINHNIAALNTYRMLSSNNALTSKSLEKLSSGLRINRAGDDAAGLAISEKMRAQIRGLDQATRNSQDAISLIQTAEGGLNETHAILQRMRVLADQAANDTNVVVDREEIQKEINQLTSEINRIGNTTEFNTMKLLDGSRSSEAIVTIPVGDPKIESGTGELVTVVAGAGVEYTGSSEAWKSSVTSDITISSGPADEEIDWAALNSSGKNEITLTKTADGGLKVDILATEDASGAATDTVEHSWTFSAETMANGASGGVYEVESHGVKFNLDLEAFKDVEANHSVTLDLTAKYAGASGAINATSENHSLSNDFEAGSATFTSGGIKIDGSKAELAGLENIQVELSDSGKTITVTGTKDGEQVIIDQKKLDKALTSSSGSGNTDKFSYNENGIEFEFTLKQDGNGDDIVNFKTNVLDVKANVAQITQETKDEQVDASLKMQIGANTGQAMFIDVSDMRSAALKVSSADNTVEVKVTDNMGKEHTAKYVATSNVTDGTNNTNIEYALDVSSHELATAAITVINDAIESVSSERSKLGAFQNRLEHTINNLGTSAENLTAAESRIRDVDYAAAA